MKMTMIKNWVADRCSKFSRHTSGNTAIMFAMTLPILVGFIGLSTDVALWYWEERRLQSTTDSLALTAGYEALRSSTNDAIKTKVEGDLQTFYKGAKNVELLSMNRPPTSGSFAGDNTAMEVVTKNQQPRLFSVINLGNDVSFQARAVAQIVDTTGFCLLGLAEELDRTVEFSGTSNINLGCGIAVNSNSEESLYVGGTVTVVSSPLSTAGNLRLSGNGKIISPNPVKELAPPVADPYASLAVPGSPSNCTYNKYVSKNNDTISPGRYCNGLRFQGSNTKLLPGTYIIDGGDFSAQGNSTITGEGVTIILTGKGNDYATMDLQGGTEISLKAPEVGSGSDYEGILIYQDRDAPKYQGAQLITNKFNGGADMDLRGVIYFPQQKIVMTGGANGNIECLQVVAQAITFSGNTRLQNNCSSDDGGSQIIQQYVKLVE